MSVSVNEASAVLRAAVRDTIRKRTLLYLIQGAALVVAGVLALIFPLVSATGVLVLLGWLLLVCGLIQAFSLWGATQVPYFWLDLIVVVLELLVGWLLISRPEAGLDAITLLMLVFFLVGGLQRVIFALMIRPLPDWGWILGGGLVAIAAAMILFANLPQASTWLVGTLLGLQLIATGGGQVWMALKLRGSV